MAVHPGEWLSKVLILPPFSLQTTALMLIADQSVMDAINISMIWFRYLRILVIAIMISIPVYIEANGQPDVSILI